MMVVIAGLCMVCQGLGLSSIVHGKTGVVDELKQRILYWAVVCSTLYSVAVYFMSRWFTKDMYWKWRHSDMWGLSPTFKSISVVKRVKGLGGVLLGLSLTGLFVISLGLNTWLASLAKIHPVVAYGQYNVTIIRSTDVNPKGYSLLTGDVQQISMGSVGVRELTPDEDGRYIWTPIFVYGAATTLDVDNIEVYRLTPRCETLEQGDVPIVALRNNVSDPSSTIGQWNVTVGGNTLEVHSRDKANTWKTWTTINSTRQLSEDYYQNSTLYFLQIRWNKAFGEPLATLDNNVSDPAYVYAAKCSFMVETGFASGYLDSYKPIRFEMRNFTLGKATDPDAAFAWRGIANTIVASLDSADTLNNGISGYHAPLWRWMMGYDDIAPSVDTWMDKKLASLIGYVLTERFSYVGTSDIMAWRTLEVSMIDVNEEMLWIGIILQIAFLSAVVSIYWIYRRNGLEWRSDNLNYIVPDAGKENDDEENLALM